MVMTHARRPRFIVPSGVERTRYVQVLCTGVRTNGRPCSRTLGEINLSHPHDVQYTCRDCGAVYQLRKA